MYTDRNKTPLAFHYCFWYFLLPVTFLSRLYTFIKLIGLLEEYNKALSTIPFFDSGIMTELDTFIKFYLIFLGILLILAVVSFMGFFGWRKYGYNAVSALLMIGLVVYVILSVMSTYWLIEIIDIKGNPDKAMSLLSGDKNILLIGLAMIGLIVEQASELGVTIDDPVTAAIIVMVYYYVLMTLYSAMFRYYSHRKALFSDTYSTYSTPVHAGYSAPVSRAPMYYAPTDYSGAGAAVGNYNAPSAYGIGTTYAVLTPAAPAAPPYPGAAAPAAAPRKMQFCTGCGKVVEPGSGYCSACGTPVRVVNPPTPAPTTYAPPSTAAPTRPLPTDAAVPTASGITRRPAPTNRDNSGFMSAGDL